MIGTYEQTIGTRGSGISDIVLQTKNIRSEHDDFLWNHMLNEAGTVDSAHADACPSSNLWHACCTHTDSTRTGDIKKGKKGEVARMVGTLGLVSVGKSAQKTT